MDFHGAVVRQRFSLMHGARPDPNGLVCFINWLCLSVPRIVEIFFI